MSFLKLTAKVQLFCDLTKFYERKIVLIASLFSKTPLLLYILMLPNALFYNLKGH